MLGGPQPTAPPVHRRRAALRWAALHPHSDSECALNFLSEFHTEASSQREVAALREIAFRRTRTFTRHEVIIQLLKRGGSRSAPGDGLLPWLRYARDVLRVPRTSPIPRSCLCANKLLHKQPEE